METLLALLCWDWNLDLWRKNFERFFPQKPWKYHWLLNEIAKVKRQKYQIYYKLAWCEVKSPLKICLFTYLHQGEIGFLKTLTLKFLDALWPVWSSILSRELIMLTIFCSESLVLMKDVVLKLKILSLKSCCSGCSIWEQKIMTLIRIHPSGIYDLNYALNN